MFNHGRPEVHVKYMYDHNDKNHLCAVHVIVTGFVRHNNNNSKLSISGSISFPIGTVTIIHVSVIVLMLVTVILLRFWDCTCICFNKVWHYITAIQVFNVGRIHWLNGRNCSTCMCTIMKTWNEHRAPSESIRK